MNQARLIKNFSDLATTPQREIALQIIEAGLESIDTKKAILNNVRIEDSRLTINEASFDLKKFNRIKVVGFGKASCEAAAALEKLIGGHISDSAVISNFESTCEVVKTYHGTHPEPSPKNVQGSGKIIELIQDTKEDDLVIVIISGGGSALLCWPDSECEQGIRLYNAFLRSGGTIEELNTVRKHISMVKGGGLAKELYPATVLGIIFSDVPGGPTNTIASGPTCIDNTTVEDAQLIVDKYQLGDLELIETPKDPVFFEKVTNLEVVSNRVALSAMANAAKEAGYEPIVLEESLRLSPKETIERLKAMSRPNTAVIAGGETRLSVPKEHGEGGRNTHTTLASLDYLDDNQTFISIASDGIDNCPAAGGVADSYTKNLIKDGLNLEEFNSYSQLNNVNQTINTGPTHANVADLYLLITN